MKISKSQRNNIIFAIVILLMILPQTRQPIQILLNKGLALFGPSIITEEDQESVAYKDWKLQSINGEKLNFKNLKGKVALLNFWATWCPPCVAELPHIQSLYEDYGHKIEFVIVSNEDMSKVESFLKTKGYSIPSYKALSNFPEAIEVSSIPRTFLISKEGKIVIDKTGASNWNSSKVRSQIDKLLE